MEAPVRGLLMAERPGGLRAGEQPAFIPAGPQEAWGLNPARKPVAALRTMPVGANIAHKEWLHEFQEEQRVLRQVQQAQSQKAAARTTAFKEFSARLRTAILSAQDVSFWKATSHKLTGTETLLQTSTAMYHQEQLQQAANSSQASMHPADTVDPAADLQVSQPSTTTRQQAPAPSQSTSSPSQAAPDTTLPPADSQPAAASRPGTAEIHSSPGPGAPPSRAKQRPAWALSSQQAEQQVAQEEQDLLQFAESLDYDSFVASLDDPQLKEALQGLEQADSGSQNDEAWRGHFVRALNHVSQQRAAQQAADGTSMSGHDDVRSTCFFQRHADEMSRSGVSDRLKGQWDHSSCAGKDAAQMLRVLDATAQAEDFLRENPDMRAVHSVASVRAALAKAEA